MIAMSDQRPYDERRGDYSARKFGVRSEPRDPQSFKDAEILHPETGDVVHVKPAWQVEFDESVMPRLQRPALTVTHGYSHLKGSR